MSGSGGGSIALGLKLGMRFGEEYLGDIELQYHMLQKSKLLEIAHEMGFTVDVVTRALILRQVHARVGVYEWLLKGYDKLIKEIEAQLPLTPDKKSELNASKA